MKRGDAGTYLSKRLVLGCILLALPLLAGGQTTLQGYTDTALLPRYNADEAYTLLDEWMGLIDPNPDVLPTARETEIYRELVKAEGGTKRVASFDYNNRTAKNGMYIWGLVGTIEGSLDRIEAARDLAWLPTALDHADELLALRERAGTFSPNHGRNLKEDLWFSPHASDAGRISPLNSGHNATAIARLANWILDHPELYPQTAPVNSAIPLTVPATYYERARFYLVELKKTLEEEDRAGFFWAFDQGAHAGWVFQGDGTLDGSDLAARHPDGIPLADIRDVSNSEKIPLHPYNRVLYYVAARLETARGLQLVDAHESSSAHAAFVAGALDMGEMTLNYWRHHRVARTEPAPLGTTYTWPYGASQDSTVKYEDSVHFAMDVDPLGAFRAMDLLTREDMEGTVGSIYSRWFDRESHVYFQHLGRHLTTHPATGLPNNFYWWWGPGLLDWIGSAASPAQVQGSATKALEVFRERMRRASSDPSFRNRFLGRHDTRRTRNMKGPFQLHDLKMARAALGLSATPGTHAPVVTSVRPSASFSIPEDTPPGTTVGSVSATDADAGQTVHYWISGGNIGNRFKINPTNGTIRVNNHYVLNDEEGAVTPLEITVVDDGVPMRTATTTVKIGIRNAADSPVIPAGQAARFTPNLVKGNPVVAVKASDPGALRFFLETPTPLFSIEPKTGIIRVKNTAEAAKQVPGKTHTLQVGAIRTKGLPLITRQTVEISCVPPFGNILASSTSGKVPLMVRFKGGHTGGDRGVRSVWEFGDGGGATSASARHVYKEPGTYRVNALMKDSTGAIDRQTVEVVATGRGARIPGGLLAHYRFAEGGGITARDSSGNGNGATLSADAYNADGRIGTGLEITGAVISIPEAVYSAISNEVAVCFFLRGAPDFHPFNSVFKAVDASGNKVLNAHLPWGGEGGSYIWDAGGDRVSSSAPIPATEQWNHWVFTKDASTGRMAIYTNGVLLASGNGKTKTMGGITGFKFGGNNYRGTLDEIRIYNQALDAAEVAALYAGLPPK